jgi:hypothetical protein
LKELQEQKQDKHLEMISKVLPIAVHDDAAIAGKEFCTKSYKWRNQMVIKQVVLSIL